MKVLSTILCGLAAVALAGCGSSSSSGGNNGPDPNPEPAGLLSQVTDRAAFEASLKDGLTVMSTAEQLALADAVATRGFTGTYTQEANVDEFDAVRYDGAHLYVAPRRYFHCCFILAEPGTDPGGVRPEPERSIRILATDPDNGSADLAGTIALEDNISVQGMYVENDTLFALTGESIYGTYGEFWADVAIWAPEKLGFRVYDVSDTTDPQLDFKAEIDGIFVESRRIGNTVYIVSRYTPYLEGLHYYVETAEQQAHNEQLLANATLDDLLPKISINGLESNLVEPERCFVTTEADEAGYAVLTTITAVPLDDPDSATSTCYNEDAYGVYVSENALYFTELRPDTPASRYLTRIHKFALQGTDVRYRGSADIIGTVWRGGQADFRMSEHDGDLRLLASQFDWTNEDFVDHTLYILREANTAARRELEIVSTLPNDARPEEIGKPNERLYGVRFLGDRAYAVTFLQIDPLYALDLSDPSDPFIAGELEITGFSDFLHPVNDDLLLGLGTGAAGGVKLELFDVSNIAQPMSRGTEVLGGPGSYSEARYDRHAFTYQADANGTDRFTIPATVYSTDGRYEFLGSGLYLFEIGNKDTPALATLNGVGSINPPDVSGLLAPYRSSRDRAFIHDDTVYYVRDETVWSAFWHTPSLVNGPF